MAEARPEVESRAALAPAGALFRSLSDPTRLALVQRLAGGEARVVDLVAELRMAQSTVSSHLSCLRGCGLVDFRPEGRASVYFLTRPELMDLLACAQTLLAATGAAVALCPNYGTVPPTSADREDETDRNEETLR